MQSALTDGFVSVKRQEASPEFSADHWIVVRQEAKRCADQTESWEQCKVKRCGAVIVARVYAGVCVLVEHAQCVRVP